MASLIYSLPLACLLSLSLAQEPGLELPLTTSCSSATNVLCLTKYLSVLPYHFYRQAATTSPVTIDQIQWPSNYSATANAISAADFLVFDEARGLEILGSNPTYDFMFAVSDAVHEAPVYWEAGNRLFMSQLAPPPGFLPQLEINLDNDPPTLSEYLSNPPVYAPNGGTFHGGLIYWGKNHSLWWQNGRMLGACLERSLQPFNLFSDPNPFDKIQNFVRLLARSCLSVNFWSKFIKIDVVMALNPG